MHRSSAGRATDIVSNRGGMMVFPSIHQEVQIMLRNSVLAVALLLGGGVAVAQDATTHARRVSERILSAQDLDEVFA